ncbi:PD-(D/E)XK nuclease family protein [Gulosibacter molinativorax]|uniref:DNA 3'-5' helicase n=1 Tax=Gulosibacter molinativorax TaxID=256821 RepID=A0ABT7C5V0_9MICO|nr:PD-(D/E)XK nuclease family protein [Gulosibacter molinativorax]MDJ1370581.1 ATP-dependent helicase [Gulosibacter molinativorax]QUY62003.1 Hypotetical protein [Gulosibacter molinativorax]
MSEQSRTGRDFDLDESQQGIVEAAPGKSLAVIGAPGSGRTSTLIELVAQRIADGYRPEQILAIAANRKLAADLRDRLEKRVRVAASGGTLGRTAASIAIEIIAAEHARLGQPAPKLLTGSQQDDILADLIAGLLDPEAPGAAFRAQSQWPDWFRPETLELRGFRDEMRALLTGMVEDGISPVELAALALSPESEPAAGTRHRMLWGGAAQLAQQYFDVLDQAYEGAFDSAQALSEAAQILLERDAAGLERRVFDEVRLVVVDDSQELTEPAARLIRAFERQGAQIVTFGEPDIATGAFHGGRANLAVNWRGEGEAAPERVVLEAVHRHGPTLRGVVQRASAGLGSALAGTQRQSPSAATDASESATDDTPIAAQAITPSEVEELAVLTGYLRRLHLLEGVAWDDMAVITRSGARLPSLARAFDRARIPTSTSTPLPAAEDATVRAIIALGEAAVAGSITPEVLQSVLRSPLFGLDPLELRRMRRAHYLADLEGEGRSGAQVMTDTVNARLRGEADVIGEATLTQLAESHGWLGARAIRGVAEVLTRMMGRLRDGDPIDTALYEAWRDDARAKKWQEIALGNDSGAVAMNRRLDALTVLFDRAKRFVEREPHASLAAFLAEWQRDSVVDDSLAGPSGRRAVALTTPAGAVGRQWRVVVVAGVNEGVWPNLKVRDSLLGAGRLDEARGEAPLSIIDRRAEVLNDETRMLTASLSKASERILVTATSGEDTQPSRYLHTLRLEDLPSQFALGGTEQFGYAQLTLEGLVAVLRRDIAVDSASHEASEHALARLSEAGVTGAHPDSWFGVRGRSTVAPLEQSEDGVLRLQLYPSGIDSFFECGVNWFLDQYSGSAPSDAMTIGNILHLAAEREAAFADRVEMMDFAEAKLREMNFDADWVEEIQAKTVRDAAESLWTYLRRDGSEVIANEYAFRFLLERELDSGVRAEVTVSGRIDRMEATEAGLRIIDIKTGATKPSKEKLFENRQLRAYQLAHREGVLPEEAGAIKVETAALLFPRIPAKKELWSLAEQNAFDADELDLVEDNFLDAALGEAGFPMAGLDPDLDAPPTYLSDHDKHCLSNNRNCHIHAIAEVTE